MKQCRKCKLSKQISEFYKDKSSPDGLTKECKECRKLAEKSYYSKHAEKRRINAKNKRLRNTNGDQLTYQQFQQMKENQDNKCGICKTEMYRPYVDHCHKSGKIRMLLCHHCNCLLGNSKENIDILNSAIEYIEKFK